MSMQLRLALKVSAEKFICANGHSRHRTFFDDRRSDRAQDRVNHFNSNGLGRKINGRIYSTKTRNGLLARTSNKRSRNGEKFYKELLGWELPQSKVTEMAIR